MKEQRCVTIAIVGPPNAGKSTLVNHLVGSKVTIVTPKAQTTRATIRGIAMHDQTQMVLVDTPGIFRPSKTLDKAMVRSAWEAIGEADWQMLMVDAKKGVTQKVVDIIEGMRRRDVPAVLVLNKVDTISPEQLMPLTAELNQMMNFERTFMISALKRRGTADILRFFNEKAPVMPWIYPEDQAATMPMRFLAAELTREQLFLRTHEEVPYGTHVETDSFEEKKDGSAKISQTIYVTREAQKRIIVGKGGSMLKELGQRSRTEMAKVFGFPVHLFLFVKVKEDWQESPESFQNMGLDFKG